MRLSQKYIDIANESPLSFDKSIGFGRSAAARSRETKRYTSLGKEIDKAIENNDLERLRQIRAAAIIGALAVRESRDGSTDEERKKIRSARTAAYNNTLDKIRLAINELKVDKTPEIQPVPEPILPDNSIDKEPPISVPTEIPAGRNEPTAERGGRLPRGVPDRLNSGIGNALSRAYIFGSSVLTIVGFPGLQVITTSSPSRKKRDYTGPASSMEVEPEGVAGGETLNDIDEEISPEVHVSGDGGTEVASATVDTEIDDTSAAHDPLDNPADDANNESIPAFTPSSVGQEKRRRFGGARAYAFIGQSIGMLGAIGSRLASSGTLSTRRQMDSEAGRVEDSGISDGLSGNNEAWQQSIDESPSSGSIENEFVGSKDLLIDVPDTEETHPLSPDMPVAESDTEVKPTLLGRMRHRYESNRREAEALEQQRGIVGFSGPLYAFDSRDYYHDGLSYKERLAGRLPKALIGGVALAATIGFVVGNYEDDNSSFYNNGGVATPHASPIATTIPSTEAAIAIVVTPDVSPTVFPEPTATAEPTMEPTAEPTQEPTSEPTKEPTLEPTTIPEPTSEPTLEPTVPPTPMVTPDASPSVPETIAPNIPADEIVTPEPISPEPVTPEPDKATPQNEKQHETDDYDSREGRVFGGDFDENYERPVEKPAPVFTIRYNDGFTDLLQQYDPSLDDEESYELFLYLSERFGGAQYLFTDMATYEMENGELGIICYGDTTQFAPGVQDKADAWIKDNSRAN